MATTLLADLTCLKTLVIGKFVIVDSSTNTYKMYNPGRYCGPVPKEFNPEDYALLITDRYAIVIEATSKMRENYIVNKLWREQIANNKEIDNSPSKIVYRVGDKIHLKEKDGIYTINEIDKDSVRLTCNTWQYTPEPIRWYHLEDIKCLAGGTNNLNRK
jgi:hypothetical protein